jgi:hypothetical protein
MSDINQNETEAAEKKPGQISLQEAMKRKLAEKKKEQGNAQSGFFHQKATNQKMKSQNTKKPNNQRRRTGV